MRAVAACLVIALANPAHARDPQGALQRARVCWAALDPDCAMAALIEVRAAITELGPADRHEAWRLSAEVALAQGADAQPYLAALLELDPAFAPRWSEAWLAALEVARKAAPDRLPPTVRVELPTTVRPKSTAEITVFADDPSGIQGCDVTVDGQRTALLSADGLTFRGTLPKARAPGLLVIVEVEDRAGNVARSEHPITVTTPPSRATPVVETWWFWTVVGVVVVGGAVGLGLALSGSDAPVASPTGDLDIHPEVP